MAEKTNEFLKDPSYKHHVSKIEIIFIIYFNSGCIWHLQRSAIYTFNNNTWPAFIHSLRLEIVLLWRPVLADLLAPDHHLVQRHELHDGVGQQHPGAEGPVVDLPDEAEALIDAGVRQADGQSEKWTGYISMSLILATFLSLSFNRSRVFTLIVLSKCLLCLKGEEKRKWSSTSSNLYGRA